MRSEGRGRHDEDEVGCDPELSGLADAVSALRAQVPVRPEWRDAVLDEVRGAGHARRGRRGWTITPPTALAAALAFMALGALGAVGVMSLRDNQARVATSTHPEGVAPPPAARRPAPSPVRFTVVAPTASRVSLVGDFNGWDAGATPMHRVGDGRRWSVELSLPPGRHVYAFVVDGDVTPDPSALRAGEEDFGVPISVVLVGYRGS